MYSKSSCQKKKIDRFKTGGMKYTDPGGTRCAGWRAAKIPDRRLSDRRERDRRALFYSLSNQEHTVIHDHKNHLRGSGDVIQRQPIFGDNFGYNYRDITPQQMINGHANIHRNVENAHGFQLGWDSIVGFTSNVASTMFTFTHGYQAGGGPMPAGIHPIPAAPLPLPGAPLPPPPAGTAYPTGSQIVTRGVSGCSVIMVTVGNRHAMAHLDRNQIINANLQVSINRITTLVPLPAPPVAPAAPVFPEIFVSIHNNNPNNPAFFSRRLIEHYYQLAPPNIQPGPPAAGAPLLPYLTQGLPPGHRVRVLNRSVPGGNDMFAHPEIGMSTDAVRGRQVFGIVRGNDFSSPDNHISTSDSRFVESLAAPQAAFDALRQTGAARERSAERWASLYRFFHCV